MTVALLSIGTALLRGEVTDTNGPWLAAELTQMGFRVAAYEATADDPKRLASALSRLGDEHTMIVATGGLGPTNDDVTAEVAATVAGVPLHCNEDALAAIRRRLKEREIEETSGHEKQAMLPEGSTALLDGDGISPGFIQRIGRSTAYFLPGVPVEMRSMFAEEVAPRIRAAATKDSFQICLRTYGMRESEIGKRLQDLERAHPEIGVVFVTQRPEVHVRILARSANYADARGKAEAAARDVRERLGEIVYGEGDDTMPVVAGRLVRAKGWRLATAESCTGGLIARQLTAQPASDFFAGSAVTYANSAKTRLLGVSEDTLRGHGAVSAEVAAEMAEGARRTFDCQLAVSVTGIAGPSGATSDKPLGLVYWAASHPGGTEVEHEVFDGNRAQVQRQAALAALNLLRRILRPE
ncbi:MAG: CinA family nicotinamide mononucleotide deamidase-related protein [Deltaproteobacteria bacterium]|jgi:nicotinamide-nucleotide amidase|nr:CinA family nicotinamide mononucleotide deamidase-related protein [Deltaproteobacteria bacterium]MBW2536012.1 CinA family nicotinamide mononucleotide deamidase-related protein [Deltaproteobacteria bacterium]